MPDPFEQEPFDTDAREVILGRYRVERRLGRGGMGEVLLAFDELLGRPVALKRLRAAGDDVTSHRDTILREARRASHISDRRIAAIHDVVEHGTDVLLVMEYVPGLNFRQRMADSISLDEFWDLAIQSVEAIAVAHEHGIIHRDIKPENLMLTSNGQVKVLDFGIAKAITPSGDTATVGTAGFAVVGTPQYMSPEAHLGQHIDARTDIFSLGVVFYELLTSRRPFEGTTYAAVADKVLHTEPAPVVEIAPACGDALSRVVSHMLAKDTDARVGSAAELMHELQQARVATEQPSIGDSTMSMARHLALGRAGPATDTPLRRPHRRRRIVGFATAAAALAAAVTVVTHWRDWVPPVLPHERLVAVFPANAAAPDPEFAAFALGSSELLWARLQRHLDQPGFQLASFDETYGARPQSAMDARKLVGANVAVMLTLDQKPDVLHARVDIVETGRGRSIATRTIDSPASEPFAFFDRLYRETATALGVTPRDETTQQAFGIQGAGTLRFYVQGFGRKRTAATPEDVDKAIQDLEQGCRAEPDAASPRAALAAAMQRAYGITKNTESLAQAETTAREAIALDPARPEPYRALAYILSTMKKQPEALQAYARAESLNPDDVEVIHLHARTYWRLAQPEKEKQAYLAAIAAHPHWYQPYWWLATSDLQQGHVEEAIQAYQGMVQRSPLLVTGHANLGGVLVFHGDYTRGIEALRQSIALRPTNIAFMNLGTAYFNSRRFSEAIDAYNQAFQFGVADYQAWINLGDAYYFLRSRSDQANRAYAEGVRLGRASIASRSRTGGSIDAAIPANLAAVFPRLGQPDSARVYLDRAMGAGVQTYLVQYCAALTCWQLDRKEEALRWLEKSVQNGYPVVWLRDSAVFDDWRTVPGFRALVSGTSAEAPGTASRN